MSDGRLSVRAADLLRSPRTARLVRFGVTGILSNLFLLAVFAGLAHAGVQILAATALVYALGMSITYFINRNWSFASDKRHLQAGAGYIATQLLGLALQLSMQWLLHERLGAPALIVQVLAIPVVACFSFVMLEWVVFSPARPNGRDERPSEGRPR